MNKLRQSYLERVAAGYVKTFHESVEKYVPALLEEYIKCTRSEMYDSLLAVKKESKRSALIIQDTAKKADNFTRKTVLEDEKHLSAFADLVRIGFPETTNVRVKLILR